MLKKLSFLVGTVALCASCQNNLPNPEETAAEETTEVVPLATQPEYLRYKNDFLSTFEEAPSADQNWDFYSQAVAPVSVTRAGAVPVITSTTQPTDAAFQEEIQGWQNLFRKNEDNRNKGVRNYNLTTTGNFKAYAVWYSGLYQKYSRNAFEFGMRINGQLYKLFGNRHLPLDTQEPDAVNPGFAADIEIERGITFDFYMKYTETVKNSEGKLVSVTNTLYSKDGNSILLYSDETQEKMIIGFEDKIQDNWTPNGNKDIPDFSDVIVYIEGNPLLPVLEAKRFLCEDMSGDQADFDFNDIVFDVQPIGGKRAKVTLWAGGGVYNAKIKIGGTWLSNAQGETEIHKLLGIRPPQYLANTDNRTTMPFVTTMEVENVQALNDFKDVEIYVQTQNGQPWICSGFPGDGDIPLMIAVPTSVRWMIEKYRITRGYPDFYYGEWYNADNIHPEFMFDTSKYMAAGLQQ